MGVTENLAENAPDHQQIRLSMYQYYSVQNSLFKILKLIQRIFTVNT